MSVYQRFFRQMGVGLGLASCACGSASLEQAKLAQAQSAMHAAETLGAAQDPKAKQSLDAARNEVAEAQRLASKGDADKGNMYLERAQADAELAAQLMRTRNAEDTARQAWAKSKAAGGPAQAQ